MAERSGHGRASRPETFTTRAASQRLHRIGDASRTPRRPAEPQSPACRSATGRAGCARRSCAVRPAELSLVGAEIWNGGGDDEGADHRGPEARAGRPDTIPARSRRHWPPVARAAQDSQATRRRRRSPATATKTEPGQHPDRCRRETPPRSGRPNGSSRAQQSESAAARDRTGKSQPSSRTPPMRTATPPPRPRQSNENDLHHFELSRFVSG